MSKEKEKIVKNSFVSLVSKIFHHQFLLLLVFFFFFVRRFLVSFVLPAPAALHLDLAFDEFWPLIELS